MQVTINNRSIMDFEYNSDDGVSYPTNSDPRNDDDEDPDPNQEHDPTLQSNTVSDSVPRQVLLVMRALEEYLRNRPVDPKMSDSIHCLKDFSEGELPHIPPSDRLAESGLKAHVEGNSNKNTKPIAPPTATKHNSATMSTQYSGGERTKRADPITDPGHRDMSKTPKLSRPDAAEN